VQKFCYPVRFGLFYILFHKFCWLYWRYYKLKPCCWLATIITSLAGEIKSKINLLLRSWPTGTVAVLPWLEKQGVYQQLAYEYERSGWFERVGRSAYFRAGDHIEWPGAVRAMQSQLGLRVHVGGKSALELKGLRQSTKNLCKHEQSIGYHQSLLGSRIGHGGVKTNTMNSFLPVIFRRLPPLLKGFTKKFHET